MSLNKQSWQIETTLIRTFDGTKEEAEVVAKEDLEYYQDQVDGDQFVNIPVSFNITEIKPRGHECQ